MTFQWRNSEMKAALAFPKACAALLSALMLVPALTFAQHYKQTNLVTDLSSGATFKNDNNLKNPWGLARSTTSPWWVGDNNAGVSTIYDGTRVARSLVVKIPGPNGSPANFVSAPTGVVFNGSPDFDLSPGDPKTAA